MQRIWNTLVGILLPVLARPTWRAVARLMRWPAHVLMMAAILACLWRLNRYFDLPRALRSPWPALHASWLPLVFVLCYVLSWLVYWLWLLLGPHRVLCGFPEIDEAWSEALAALARAGIDVAGRPLFLVLGRPAGAEDALFHAADLPFAVKQVPRRADAPLHVYAGDSGIYVTCAGASLLGRYAHGLARRSALLEPTTARVEDRAAQDIQQLLARALQEGRGPDQLSDEERHNLSLLLAQEPIHDAGSSHMGALADDEEGLDAYLARLEHLCRLLAACRRPGRPVNGILVLIPLLSGQSEEEAGTTITLCRRDLRSARAILQVDCPVRFLIADLEKASGFTDWLAQQSAEQKREAVVCRFPLVPDLRPTEVPFMIESGIHWLCRSLVPALVYDSLSAETNFREAFERNARLFGFVDLLHDYAPRLGRIVAQSVQIEDGVTAMTSGCFLAGTGFDPEREQAFAPAVFRDLIAHQDDACWTAAALDEERACRRLLRVSIAGLTALTAGFIGMGLFSWYH